MILSTLSGWRLLAITPWVRARARALLAPHSTVEEGARARADPGQRKTVHANRKYIEVPSKHRIDLVVAEMGLFRRGFLSMYNHQDSFRESQFLAQQKDSLHRIIYTERRNCDRISNDPVILKFSLPTLGCFALLFYRSRAARDKITLAFVLQLLR